MSDVVDLADLEHVFRIFHHAVQHISEAGVEDKITKIALDAVLDPEADAYYTESEAEEVDDDEAEEYVKDPRVSNSRASSTMQKGGTTGTAKASKAKALTRRTIVKKSNHSSGKKVFVLDEVSMASCQLLVDVNKKLNKGIGSGIQHNRFFGDIPIVVLTGDFMQFPPAAGTVIVNDLVDKPFIDTQIFRHVDVAGQVKKACLLAPTTQHRFFAFFNHIDQCHWGLIIYDLWPGCGGRHDMTNDEGGGGGGGGVCGVCGGCGPWYWYSRHDGVSFSGEVAKSSTPFFSDSGFGAGTGKGFSSRLATMEHRASPIVHRPSDNAAEPVDDQDDQDYNNNMKEEEQDVDDDGSIEEAPC
ncbi:hypothetical protein QBC39DRAFT_333886 [Podospora conica]|nr:hypothetical protein QBC39DRAFT_333886 [Schizothecium conicum]